VNFEWDPSKAAKNRRKHGVSFQEAATAFGDPFALTYNDPDHSVDEERFITLGLSAIGRLLIVAHCDRSHRIRIISARETTRFERMEYEQEN
jgi:uncharacterized DUF497 family protein